MLKENKDIRKLYTSASPKLLWVVLLSTIYFITAKLGLFFAIVHTNITALWPPSGIALAAFFVLGRWIWPGIFVGAFFVNLSIGTPVLISIGIGIGNTLGPFLGAELLHRFKNFHSDFSTIKDVLIFILAGVALTPLISASVGVISLWMGGQIAPPLFRVAWLSWWSGDAVGILTITSLILVVRSLKWQMPSVLRILEALLIVCVLFSVAVFAYRSPEALTLLVYPCSVWAAIRFRQLGVLTLALVLKFVSIPLIIARSKSQSYVDETSLLFLIYRLQIFLSTAHVTGMLLAAEITSRHLAELRLKEKEDQLNMIVSNTPDHVVMQDEHLRYTLVINPQLELTQEDMIGKTDHDFLSKDDADKLTQIKLSVLHNAKSLHVQLPLVSKTGEVEYFDGSYIPKYNSKGEVDGIIGYFRNITERKRAEQAQRAMKEAEAANQAKDQFLATLSHELRTPLTAILTWTQLLKTGKLDAEKSKIGIRNIEESALAQNQLINDLLDVSRIVSGKIAIELHHINTRETLSSALETIRPTAVKKSIEIIENYQDGQITVLADPTRLKQVFWNLLINSVKFTPPGGKIIVTLDQIETASGKKARVRIEDTGKGISPEFLPLIFRRFIQADLSSTRVHGGMGLGLSLARGLLDLQGGTIEAFSAGKDKGSTFTVLLPLFIPAAVGNAPLIPETSFQKTIVIFPNVLSNLKILFLDDESKIREAMVVALSSYGAIVKQASSVQEAKALLEHFEPDIIVSDIAMPFEDGISFIRWIRSQTSETKRNTPAIALTAFAGREDRKKAYESGYQPICQSRSIRST